VVTVLLGAPPLAGPAPDPVDAAAGGPLELDRAEQAALAVLAGSGLVPPLRLVPGERADDEPSGPGRPCRPDRRAAEAG
jgi:hypothetical protein